MKLNSASISESGHSGGNAEKMSDEVLFINFKLIWAGMLRVES
jgi:hypothetical protein